MEIKKPTPKKYNESIKDIFNNWDKVQKSIEENK